MGNGYNIPITIDHSQYNKICDDLMFLGNNAILKFNVGLNRENEKYGKINYHREVGYTDRNQDQCYSIKRSFDFYLSIENFKPNDKGEKAFIRIGINEILSFRALLHRGLEWINGEQYKDLYVYKNKKLIMLGKPDHIKLENLPLSKQIIMEPSIVRNFNNEDIPSIRMYLSDTDNYTDIAFDSYMGLIYLIDTIDMYACAQNLVNYLGRPEFGTNLFQMDNNSYQSNNNYPSKGNKVGRQIPNKSIFDE